jgi:hypothetical protein
VRDLQRSVRGAPATIFSAEKTTVVIAFKWGDWVAEAPQRTLPMGSDTFEKKKRTNPSRVRPFYWFS